MSNSNKTDTCTITYHRTINYGAVLQSYALQQTILALGAQNQILDIAPNHSPIQFQLSKNPVLMTKRAVQIFFSFIHYKELNRLYHKFYDFVQKRLVLTKTYDSIDDLEKNPPGCSKFITGSDQVFTFNNTDFLVALRLLDFHIPGISKYSYAASLGKYDLTDDQKIRLMNILSQYQRVSVREQAGAKYLKNLISQDIQIHIDPVFLMTAEQWKSIASPVPRYQNYILYFEVNGNPLSNKVLKLLKKKYGYEIVSLQIKPISKVRAEHYIRDAGPEEFLSAILNAKMVVTTSFHGTAFSAIFHKKFVALSRKDSNPVRIQEILQKLGLSEQMVTEENVSQVCDIMEKIDYSYCDTLILSEKQKSLDYLRKILND